MDESAVEFAMRLRAEHDRLTVEVETALRRRQAIKEAVTRLSLGTPASVVQATLEHEQERVG